VGFAAGVRGELKGCATPGLEVAAGAPESLRGTEVVAVEVVMGVDAREGVVVRVRWAVVIVVVLAVRAGTRRERQRVQIMVFGERGLVVVVVWCVGPEGVKTNGSSGLVWAL
jgi:hypothetical protein